MAMVSGQGGYGQSPDHKILDPRAMVMRRSALRPTRAADCALRPMPSHDNDAAIQPDLDPAKPLTIGPPSMAAASAAAASAAAEAAPRHAQRHRCWWR